MKGEIFFCKKEGESTVAYAGDSFLVSDPIPIELARRNVYITATEMSFKGPEDDDYNASEQLWLVRLHYGKWPFQGHEGQLVSCSGLSEQDKSEFIDYLKENLEAGNFDDAIKDAVTCGHLAPGQEVICKQ